MSFPEHGDIMSDAHACCAQHQLTCQTWPSHLSTDEVAWNSANLLVPYVTSMLKISWDLFLLKNRDLKDVSVPSALSGDVLRPLTRWLRKGSDGELPAGRACIPHRTGAGGQANAHLGSWRPDGPSCKTTCSKVDKNTGRIAEACCAPQMCVRRKRGML